MTVMSSFSAVIKEFQTGSCSLPQVEMQIERDIALGVVEADFLLTKLNEEHSQSPFQAEDLLVLQRCIWDAETRRQTQLSGRQQEGTRIAFPVDTAPSESNRPDHSRSSQLPAATGGSRPIITGASGEKITTQTVKVGDVINGRFELEELIGKGGMSQVFRAVDKRKLEAHSRVPYVAVKVMNVPGADPGEAFVAMQREAQKSQSLNHPNILRVNDFDRDGGIVYTVMELLNGQSLNAFIYGDKTKLDNSQSIEFINRMASALSYAHEQGIVHADFKPSNVFVTTDDQIRVIDFGIARAIQPPDMPEEDKTVFDPKSLGALTPAYASPEMLENKDTDPRDDIYALGCVAYELLAGKHPFSRLRATEARDNEHPLMKPANISNHQWLAIKHALAFNREARTPSARMFMEELSKAPALSLTKLGKPVGVGIAVLGLSLSAYWFATTSELFVTPEPIQDCPTCPVLSVIQPKAFKVGQDLKPASGVYEYPIQKVAITQDYGLAINEVTVAEFREFVEATGTNITGCHTPEDNWQFNRRRSWHQPGFQQTEQHPVSCVSWNDAQIYLEWLSNKTGFHYRLPSETEWEYAAREVVELPLSATNSACTNANVADRSTQQVFPKADVLDCNDGYAFTRPIDHSNKEITDLRGNLFEWTADCWNPNYIGLPLDGSPRTTGDCRSRVLRGGSWFSAPDQQRLTFRNRFNGNHRSSAFGFRVARSIERNDKT